MTKTDDFQSVVDAYSNDLYRFAFWLCRNEHSAEDLVQETFLRAWRSFSSLRDASAAKAWLLTTCRREHYRRKPSKEVFSIDDERVSEDVYRIDSYSIGSQLNAEDELDMEKRLVGLPVQYREVIVLQLLFGYSTQEIAVLLSTTEPAVANRLLRARRLLQTQSQNSSGDMMPNESKGESAGAQIIPLRKRPS